MSSTRTRLTLHFNPGIRPYGDTKTNAAPRCVKSRLVCGEGGSPFKLLKCTTGTDKSPAVRGMTLRRNDALERGCRFMVVWVNKRSQAI